MIAGKVDVTKREGNVMTGRVQNGSHGRWVAFSAEWGKNGWKASFTDGCRGIRPERVALLGQKVAQSLGTPVLKAA